MKRVAILSDLHGNRVATAAVLSAIEEWQPDAVYCLGDLVGYGPHPNETIELIREADIPTLMGNYDDGVGFDRDDCGCAYRDKEEEERGQRSLIWTRQVTTPENKKWLRRIPFDIRFDLAGKRVRLVHGSPRTINEYLFEDRDVRSLARIAVAADADCLVFGHTHKPWARIIEGVQFVNAGSVGKPKDGDPQAAWVALQLNADGAIETTVHRVPYDIELVASAIRAQSALPDRFADDLYQQVNDAQNFPV